jgi:glycosyltransferase involved in cell wall biosynthesis
MDWIRGSEQCLLDLLANIDRSRFRPVVACTAPTMAREAERLGVTAHCVGWWETAVVPPAWVRAALARILRDERIALVHANMTATVPAVLPAARRLRLPVVAHLHMPQTDEFWRIRELVHQTDVAVGVAEHVLAELRADGMADARLRVIHNAVDTRRLMAGDATGLRGGLGLGSTATVAVSVGSLIPRKGHDVTLRALARVRAEGRDVHLVVCGTDDDAQRRNEAGLRRLAAELGLADVAHFVGYRPDVGAILRDAADIFVASARDEALPLNVLEAQWLGLPVVASDVAGHRESVGAAAARFVPPDDDAALARALADLAAAPAERAALGAAGRTFVDERFSMARYVGDFEALYAALLARPRAEYSWFRSARWVPAYTRWVGRLARRRLGLAGARVA